MFLCPFLKRNNGIRNALSKFPTLFPNFPRFQSRTQANIHISAHDSIGPSSILPITRFLSGYFVNSELELELIQTQMAQKPMLRAEVGMRVRCANKASAE